MTAATSDMASAIRSRIAETHAVFGQIDRCCHQIIDRGESCLALNVIIDNAEVLQVRISIPQSAVESDESEETIRILDEMR